MRYDLSLHDYLLPNLSDPVALLRRVLASLLEFNKAATPLLAGILKAGSWSNRIVAVHALGAIGPGA